MRPLAREAAIWCETAAMKKFLAVIVIALVVAATVWVVVRVQLANRLVTVPELLPGTTLLLLQAPDLKRTRGRWRESDLYKIWREPAVQAWLKRALDRLPTNGNRRQTLNQFLQLGPTHAFLALTSLERNEPKLIGGFRFDGGPDAARKFAEEREAEWLPKTPDTKREKILHGQHTIEIVTVSRLVFASVYDDHWFFASNDVATLKALLDRADRHQEKAGPSLQENAAFAAATRPLPNEYGVMIFLDPRPFVEKLRPLLALTGQALPMNQLEGLRKVETVAAAFGLEHGKMRERDFVAMPQLGAAKKLTRPLLAAADGNTVFYSASQVHWSDNLLSPAAPAAAGLPALLQQFAAALNGRGISPVDLRQAFGPELELAGNWAAEAHWPTLLLTLPVTDPARARRIAEALTAVEIAEAPWTKTERDGVVFYNAQPFGGFVPLNPALAVSDKVMVAGSDLAAVEAALTRLAAPGGELQKSVVFRDAVAQVQEPGSAFSYVDTRLLFERVDAAARPLLLMGATFYPAMAKNFDLAKLPPADTIAKHLSPIVMSQHYEVEGYVTDSIGPVTLREATVGLAAAAGGLFIYLQEGLKAGQGFLQNLPPNPVITPAPVLPSASPTPSPF